MSTDKPVILIVDDERNIHYSFRRMLSDDYALLSAHTAEQGVAMLRADQPDVVIMDVKLPEMGGLEALQAMREIDTRIPIIMMTAFASVNTAINAMKHGAFEYLLKPFDSAKMRELIAEAVKSSIRMQRAVQLEQDVTEYPADFAGDAVVGQSEAMQDIYKLIGQVAAQDVTVLIRGESGTGKELVARAIYQHSLRADQPFLEINCAALPEQLLESELFGHEQGAFTGASRQHIGKFEQVDGGTLFLDEIGEMSLVTQAKILRVIQQGIFMRVGGNKLVETNVRLIAATNRNLEEMLRAGTFRRDLYYRLNIISLKLPSLRERKEDIPALIHYFIYRYGRETGKSVSGLTASALDTLVRHPLPGNVRQLENAIRRAVVLSKGNLISEAELLLDADSQSGQALLAGDEEQHFDHALDLYLERRDDGGLWADVERKMISKALKKCAGNQVQAAKLLGIHRNSLRNRMERYGISSTGHTD